MYAIWFILDFVSFRSCNKPLRNVDYRTLVPLIEKKLLKMHFSFEFVAQGMNYLLTLTRESDTVSFWQEVG